MNAKKKKELGRTYWACLWDEARRGVHSRAVAYRMGSSPKHAMGAWDVLCHSSSTLVGGGGGGGWWYRRRWEKDRWIALVVGAAVSMAA